MANSVGGRGCWSKKKVSRFDLQRLVFLLLAECTYHAKVCLADVQGQQHLIWTKTSPKSFVTGPFTMLSKEEEMLKETGNVLFIPS